MSQKIAIGVALQFWKMVGGKEATNAKRMSQVRSARKKSIRIELTNTSGYINSKTMRKSWQKSDTFKFPLSG